MQPIINHNLLCTQYPNINFQADAML